MQRGVKVNEGPSTLASALLLLEWYSRAQAGSTTGWAETVRKYFGEKAACVPLTLLGVDVVAMATAISLRVGEERVSPVSTFWVFGFGLVVPRLDMAAVRVTR